MSHLNVNRVFLLSLPLLLTTLATPALAVEAEYERYWREGKYAKVLGYVYLPAEGARVVQVDGEVTTNYGQSWVPVSGSYSRHINRYGEVDPTLWKFSYRYKSDLVVYARTKLYYTMPGKSTWYQVDVGMTGQIKGNY